MSLTALNCNMPLSSDKQLKLLKTTQSLRLDISKERQLINNLNDDNQDSSQSDIQHSSSSKTQMMFKSKKGKCPNLKHFFYKKTISFPVANNSNDTNTQIHNQGKQSTNSIETNLNKPKASLTSSIQNKTIVKKLSIVTLPKLQVNNLINEQYCDNDKAQEKEKSDCKVLNNERRKRLPTMERIEMELDRELKKKKHLQRKDTVSNRTIGLSKLFDNKESSSKEANDSCALGNYNDNHNNYPLRNSILNHNKPETIPEVLTEETRIDTKPNENNYPLRINIVKRNNKSKVLKKKLKKTYYNNNWLFQKQLITGGYYYKKNLNEMAKTETKMKFLQNKINNTFTLLKKELDDTFDYYQYKEDLY